MIDETWIAVSSTDDRARALYMRHYSSAKRPRHARGPARSRNSDRIVGPGEALVLLTPACDAVFAWRRQRYRMDGQTGIECVIFRNEGEGLSSTLIIEAEARAWCRWPSEGRLFTFIDSQAVRSTNPGYCFQAAGWTHAGVTHRGLVILEKHVEA